MPSQFYLCFFYNDSATTEIYTLSLHDALPIYHGRSRGRHDGDQPVRLLRRSRRRTVSLLLQQRERARARTLRSEEHTSELQSPDHLVCRLLLKKKTNHTSHILHNPTLSTHYTH